MRGKAGGWALFLALILLLSFAAVNPHSHTVDHAMVTARLLLVALLSVLIVRERWQYREHQTKRRSQDSSDPGDTLLQRMRRWYYGEEKSAIPEAKEPLGPRPR